MNLVFLSQKITIS